MNTLNGTFAYIRYCFNPEPSKSVPIGPLLVAGIVTTIAIFAVALGGGMVAHYA